MEELETQTYCQRAALELAALITHQRRPRGRQRRDSALLRRFITVCSAGDRPPHLLQGGPWRVGTRPLKKPGRGGLDFIPLVQRGRHDDHGLDAAGGGGAWSRSSTTAAWTNSPAR